jgi:hypothetical protein
MSSASKNIRGPSGRRVKQSETERVSAHAQAELERLKALPPTSYKWTWGVDITENEVLAINQKKGKGKAQHSGYIASLPDGPPQNKEWSETPSLPTVSSYGRPPTVTGHDAGLYFSESDSDVSNAGTAPLLPVPAAAPVPDSVPVPHDVANDADLHTVFEAAMAFDFDSSSASAGSTTDADPVPAADSHGNALMQWLGQDDVANDAGHTAFQAAIAFDCDSSSARTGSTADAEPVLAGTGSLTGFDAAAIYFDDSTTSSSGHSNPPSAFATTSDAAEVFFSSSEADSAGSVGESDADADDASANSDSEPSVSDESPSTSQIEHPSPTRITLPVPVYTHVDFSYVDDSWLSGPDDDMDTMEDT